MSRAVACPTCHAAAGQPCSQDGRVLAIHHEARCVAGRVDALASRTGKTTEPPRYRGRWRRP